MAGEPEHCDVVKGVEVILREASFTPWLHKIHLGDGIAELGNDPAMIRIRFVERAQLLDHHLVVKPEAGEVFQQIDIRETSDHVVIGPAGEEEER